MPDRSKARAWLTHLTGADHRPSLCADRAGQQWAANFTADLKDEAAPPRILCECPCWKCRRGRCPHDFSKDVDA